MKNETQISKLIAAEEERQRTTINLIASENYPSDAVRVAVGSIFSAKYAEGEPGNRFYEGQEFADQVETLASERAKKLFDCQFANVKPLSGSPANFAIYTALAGPGGRIVGMNLADGGHLTHGASFNASGKFFAAKNYGVDSSGKIDFAEVEQIVAEHQPAVLVAGATAYPFEIDFKKFAEIAHRHGAKLLADISHIAGLIAGGVHPSPFPHADVAMTTTHKSLRGPRGAMILSNDPEVAKKIIRAIFPGLQGGPHLHTIAGIAEALGEASEPGFKKYAEHVVENAKKLAESLRSEKFKIIGTENHLLLLDFRGEKFSGGDFATALERAGIVANKNGLPGCDRSPTDPSGVRLGTPAVTTRGMGPDEMQKIAEWISDVRNAFDGTKFDDKKLITIGEEVSVFAKKFPLVAE